MFSTGREGGGWVWGYTNYLVYSLDVERNELIKI